MQEQQRKSFIMGVVTALAIVIVLGGVYMLGAKFGGAQGAGPTAQQPTGQQPTQPSGPEGDASKIAKVSDKDHIRGNEKAPITMIEFSDFQCPFCQRFHGTVQQVLADYKDKVRVVYRHFPLRSIHPQAQKAAEASECASEQGKFWEMHDKLFDLNAANTLSLDTMKNAAKELGLNTTKFNDCLDSGKMAPIVEADYQDGIAGGVSGTPGTFVNGQYLAGALPYDEVKSILDSLL